MNGTLSRYEKLTLLVTAMTALAAIVTIIFVGLQWHELHLGGKDTHDLAKAAIDQAAAAKELAQHADVQAAQTKASAEQMKSQAEQTKQLADEMKAQAASTETIATEAKIQARAAEKSADAVKDSVTVAQNSLELSLRPWVSVKVEIAGPLTWDQNGGHLSLRYTFSNVGHSPALGFFSLPQLVVEPSVGMSPVKERQDLCRYVTGPNVSMKDVLFPGEIRESFMKVNVSRADAERANPSWKGTTFSAYIIDCTAYHSNFSKQIYSVANSRSLDTTMPADQPNPMQSSYAFTGTLALPIDKDVPADHLWLLPDMLLPTEAN
jgi:hypothetical protein